MRHDGCACAVATTSAWSSGRDDWEHPWWLLLSERVHAPTRIEHVGVTNSSAWLTASRPPFAPCAIVATDVRAAGGLELNGRWYRPSWSSDGLNILVTAGVN